MEIVREVHAVPTWLMKDYLIELGGIPDGEEQVTGEGWKAVFRRIEDFRLGSITVGRVRLQIEGEPEIVENLLPRLELKLLRGGG